VNDSFDRCHCGGIKSAIRNYLIAIIVLGLLIAVLDQFWLTAAAAVSVDVVLSAEEVKNKELVDVVYRTHRVIDHRLAFPYRILGVMTVIMGLIGMWALRYRVGKQNGAH
jgi:hypothetical protein